jgi:hypothetical protein|tara:strand:- start:367 stop:600 length:234 start_codon:yes stop_codon:yes gene_type:complete
MANIKATITPANRLLVTNYAVGGTAGSIQLNNLFDVDASALSNGAVLVYKETSPGFGKWTATTQLDNEEIVLEGGTF